MNTDSRLLNGEAPERAEDGVWRWADGSEVPHTAILCQDPRCQQDHMIRFGLRLQNPMSAEHE